MSLGFCGALVTAVLCLAHVPAARAQGLPPGDSSKLAALLGPDVVGGAVASGPLASAASLLPLRNATYSFQITSGANQGNGETDTLQPAPAGSAFSWQYQAGQNTIYALQPTGDGSIMSPSEQDLGQGVVTQYSPSRPVLMKGAQPGVPQTVSLQVNVYNQGDLTDVVHTGTLALTYTYLGNYQVTVPAGTYTAALIKQDYNGSVGPASVQDTEYWFYSEGVGPVAKIEKENISAFLVYNNQEKYGKVLVSAPE